MRIPVWPAAATLVALVAGGLAAAGEQAGTAPSGQLRPAAGGGTGGLDVLQLRPDFYMIAGAGGNVAVQIGKDGVVLVNAGSADKADALVAAIRGLTDRPIRYVINTSADPDHVGGNATG